MTDVLARARTMDYRVAGNPKLGAMAGLWTLALPRLAWETVVTIGRLPATERATLSALGKRVIDADRRPETGLHDELAAHRIDLVRIGAGGPAALNGQPRLRALIAGQLTAGAVVYAEGRGLAGRPDLVQLTGDRAHVESFLLAPLSGEARALVPAHDHISIDALMDRGALEYGVRLPGYRRLQRILFDTGALRRRFSRIGFMSCSEIATHPGEPPAYIRQIAAEAGIELGASRSALLAPGDYASQKVLMLLYEGTDRRPTTLVKLAPEPSHAARLLNEAAALQQLEAVRIRAPGVVPRLRFSGVHAGRAIAGESWIEGRPFRDRALGAENCPHLHAACDWLAELALRTVEHRAAADVASALDDLMGRFLSIYRLAPDEQRYLAQQIEAVGREGTLPVVFQHGDPGSWNMLVSEEGQVVFLDWESAEPAGLPLWDLLYFMRSYGTLVSRREGVRGRLQAAARHFLTPTAMHVFIADRVADAAHSIELPPAMIRPFFYACWMHRALKEATRMTPTTIERGHYLRLLRHFIAHRAAPPLARILAGKAT
jgi:hypothetical protein